ncbi:hypothetical protein ACIA7S_09310 [Streptomyces sp. NPDC051643]
MPLGAVQQPQVGLGVRDGRVDQQGDQWLAGDRSYAAAGVR